MIPRYDHLWVRLAVATAGDTGVRVLETGWRLSWTFQGAQYVFDAMPGGMHGELRPGSGLSSGPSRDQRVSAEAWAACLQSLGGEGWELVTVAPLAGDARLSGEASLKAYHFDVQLWVFKRLRDVVGLSPERGGDEEA